VYAGEHALLGRPVAIKLLHPNLVADRDLARRFLSEARAASRLRHPGIIEVTDFGILRDGRPYMVMEQIAGEPLDLWLLRAGPQEPATALLFARELALALGAAHDAGIAHNDLKPSNVMLLEGSTADAPMIKLIDFGAATPVGTAEEYLFGTPGYMAPERILSAPSDGRADLYALGMMLYEMIAGSAPFDALTQQALLMMHVRQPLPPLTSPLGVVPAAVQEIVAGSTAKQADERYQSAAEMVADIDWALSVVCGASARRWRQ
jgi:eukaryotic-like serine/threonine-protein kinase